MANREVVEKKNLLAEINNGIKAGNHEEGYEQYSNINSIDDVVDCVKYADATTEKDIVKPFLKILKEKISEKAFTEEIFDEDLFNSTYSEGVSRETAECESVVETEIIKLSDVLQIIDDMLKK